MLTNLHITSQTRSCMFGGECLSATFKCSALRPSGPGVEPFLKDLTASLTYFTENVIWDMSVEAWKVGGWAGWGCFASIAASVSGKCFARPSEIIDCAALVYSPWWASLAAFIAFLWSRLSSSCCCPHLLVVYLFLYFTDSSHSILYLPDTS